MVRYIGLPTNAVHEALNGVDGFTVDKSYQIRRGRAVHNAFFFSQ